MTLEKSRIRFSIESATVRTVKSHFLGDKIFASELWKCPSCMEENSIDSIIHIKNCTVYRDLRNKFKIDQSDFDLVNYFKELLKLRNDAQIEWEPLLMYLTHYRLYLASLFCFTDFQEAWCFQQRRWMLLSPGWFFFLSRSIRTAEYSDK